MRVEAGVLVKDRPDFHVGDTVDIGVKIMEGDKERIQVFTGVVTGRRGGGATETFTVRRIVAGEGVERTFPLHSPTVAFIRVVRSAASPPGQTHVPAQARRQGHAPRGTEARGLRAGRGFRPGRRGRTSLIALACPIAFSGAPCRGPEGLALRHRIV